MWTIAWQTLRGRWVPFAGMWIALFLGVGLLTAMALALAATFASPPQTPERFSKAPLVVVPADVVRVETSEGTRSAKRVQPGALPAGVADKVAALGPVTADRTLFAQVAGVSERQTGHGQAALALGSYALAAGRAPQTDTEIVVSNRVAKLDDRLRVLTDAGTRTYTVSGVVWPVDFESPIFFSDAEAARLSPPVNALVSQAAPDAVRQAVGDDARVLTSSERHLADPDPNRNQRALNNMQILLGIAGGFTALVTVSVVASTFALVVTQRQREFALLRAIGATPGQIRRMVLSETLAVGLVASLFGALAGVLIVSSFRSWLIRLGAAPEWFAIPLAWLPVVAAFAIGLSVAVLGAWAASRRASATSPLVALRTAAVDTGIMTPSRRRWGWTFLGLAVLALWWIAATRPRLAIVPQIYLGVPFLVVITTLLFAPAVVPPLARFITLPFRGARSAAGVVARENILAAVRRTVATAVPVVLVVGLFASLLGAVAAINTGKSAELVSMTKTTHVITPNPAAVLPVQTVAQAQAVPGITAIPASPVAVYALDDDELRAYDAEAIAPDRLADVVDVPLEAGSLDDLGDDTIVVSENWDRSVGDKVDVWRDDGSKATLTVAAVMEDRINPLDAYIAPAHAGKALADKIYVQAASPTALSALNAAMDDQGAKVLPVKEWAKAVGDGNVQASQIGMVITLGIIGVYGVLALINTLVIASAGRLRDIAALRAAGATRGQIYWIVAAEALLVVAAATVLAALATALNIAAHYAALTVLVSGIPVAIPWLALGLTVVICALLAVAAAVLPIVRMLRNSTADRT